MSVTKHTPGPWEWDGNVWAYDADNEAPWLVQSPWQSVESKTVLKGSIKCDSEADARLIAAAPELLEALVKLAALYDAMGAPTGPCRLMADAAIAKATQIPSHSQDTPT